MHVGHIIKIRINEFFPADIILLNSSQSKGLCYIETKNLDGETNLKHKTSLRTTSMHAKDDASVI